jgi:hypothetical protein
MVVEVYKVGVDVIDKCALWLKRECYGKTTRKRLNKSSMFVSFIEDLNVGDLPSFSAEPFQGWAQGIPVFCRR